MQIQKFNFNDNDVRILVDVTNNTTWFVARDVAEILGYGDTSQAIRKHCKAPEILKGVESTGLTRSPRGMTIIPERDVYRLIMRSRLPEAEQFEEWVVGEVLPSIRKHGMYATEDKIEEMLNDPDTMIQTLQKLKEERMKRVQAEETVEHQREQLEENLTVDA